MGVFQGSKPDTTSKITLVISLATSWSWGPGSFALLGKPNFCHMLDKASFEANDFCLLCFLSIHVEDLDVFLPWLVLSLFSYCHPDRCTMSGLSAHNAWASAHLWRDIVWAHQLAFHFQSIKFWDVHLASQTASDKQAYWCMLEKGWESFKKFNLGSTINEIYPVTIKNLLRFRCGCNLASCFI